MATQALVNPELLSWARIRSGYSEDVLAKKIHVNIEKIQAWEDGELKPTFRQAQNFARITNTPFGFLFLPAPPVEVLPIPDLRTVGSAKQETLSTALRDTVELVLHKQNWYRDHLISHGESELEFIGKYSLDSPIAAVVKDIRTTLKVGIPVRGSWDDNNRELINAAESAGILIMRSGIVGNNTSRKLLVKEFRGFAISDKIAPIVFINSSDAPSARLFTLMHELAHLWLGSSGISNNSYTHAKEEKFSNAVAGEFLVPESVVKELWNKDADLIENLQFLATRLHVSKLVIARRALDLGYINSEAYTISIPLKLKNLRIREVEGISITMLVQEIVGTFLARLLLRR